MTNAFILACLALRRRAEEKRSPQPDFQPFCLEHLCPVTETRGELHHRRTLQKRKTHTKNGMENVSSVQSREKMDPKVLLR
jgi:hypothetical protein